MKKKKKSEFLQLLVFQCLYNLRDQPFSSYAEFSGILPFSKQILLHTVSKIDMHGFLFILPYSL